MTTAGRLIPGPAGGAFLGGRSVSPPRPATELELFVRSFLEVVMAGRRRSKAAKNGTAVRPVQKHIRAQNRLAQLEVRLAKAVTPGDRVWAAAEYLRSTLRYAAPHVAESIAAELVEQMRAAGMDAMADRPIPESCRSIRRSQ